MDVSYYEQVHATQDAMTEFNGVQASALKEMGAKHRLQPLAFAFTNDMMYVMSLSQFASQEEAKRSVLQLLSGKQGKFYIIAGLSKKAHPFDSNQDQLWLNIIMNNEGVMTWRKLELLFDSDSHPYILKQEQSSNIGVAKEVEGIAGIMANEDGKRMEDTEPTFDPEDA